MKLALTGGPSGGKTTLASAIQKEFARHILVVPEAASMVYGGGWPRRKGSLVKYQQRAIFYVQRELEGLLAEENPALLLVCDRGSIDGVAYWPDGDPSEYFGSVGSTLATELKRYDWVIHLDTAPAAHYDVTNPLRNETWDEAWKLNERVKAAWSLHPRRFLIGNDSGDFLSKLKRALGIVEQIVTGRTYEQIQSSLAIDDWTANAVES